MKKGQQMLYFKSCPRCKGDVNVDSDSYGAYAKCLQCGFSRDMPAPGTRRRIMPVAPAMPVSLPDDEAEEKAA
jgi:hypothetical protein